MQHFQGDAELPQFLPTTNCWRLGLMDSGKQRKKHEEETR
jgi:hypothetical protein